MCTPGPPGGPPGGPILGPPGDPPFPYITIVLRALKMAFLGGPGGPPGGPQGGPPGPPISVNNHCTQGPETALFGGPGRARPGPPRAPPPGGRKKCKKWAPGHFPVKQRKMAFLGLFWPNILSFILEMGVQGVYPPGCTFGPPRGAPGGPPGPPRDKKVHIFLGI